MQRKNKCAYNSWTQCMLELNDKLMISVRGSETIDKQSFITFMFILSIPGDLFVGIFLTIDKSSSLVIWLRKKLL